MGVFDWFSRAKEVGEGAAEVANGIGNGVGTIITRAKDTVPPELRGEIERLEVEINGALDQQREDVRVEMRKLTDASFEAAREFALEYEGRADQAAPWIRTLRQIIRPVFTIFEMAVFGLLLVAHIIGGLRGVDTSILVQLPQAYWWQFGIVLTFWFGGRAIEHVVEKAKRVN